MKRIPLFVAAVCVFAISCKKDSNSNDNAKNIVGKWTPVSDIGVVTSNGVSARDTFYFAAGSYSDFRSDGKVYSHYVEKSSGDVSDDTSSYTVSGNLLIATESGSAEKDTAQIVTLNKSSFVWTISGSEDNAVETHTFTYSK